MFEEPLRCVIDLMTHVLVRLALVIATNLWGNFHSDNPVDSQMESCTPRTNSPPYALDLHRQVMDEQFCQVNGWGVRACPVAW